MPDPEPFDGRAPERISLEGFGAVIFTGGFRPDYRAWLPWPDAFDELGFPVQRDGASTVVDGLHFVGVHFLRKRKSSILLGMGEDAAIVARARGPCGRRVVPVRRGSSRRRILRPGRPLSRTRWDRLPTSPAVSACTTSWPTGSTC
jgi:hypothetical protein